MRLPYLRGLVLVAVLLLPLAFIVPAVPTSLGGHRDWDIEALLGFTLSILSVCVLLRAPESRLRSGLAWFLPVLVLSTGGWLLANHDPGAARARLRTLVTGPLALAEAQQSQALLTLAADADARDQHAASAGYYQRSYDLVPAPNRGIHAAYAWAQAGHWASAREMVQRVRAHGGLDTVTARTVDDLDRFIAAGSTNGRR